MPGGMIFDRIGGGAGAARRGPPRIGYRSGVPGLPTACRFRRCATIVPLLFASGCASHLIRSAEEEPVGRAGQPYRHVSTSIAGQTGFSTDGPGHVTRDTCRTGDLAQVEVRRGIGQTLVTLLTLGIISPVTIEYLCEKPEPPPPCDCPQGTEL